MVLHVEIQTWILYSVTSCQKKVRHKSLNVEGKKQYHFLAAFSAAAAAFFSCFSLIIFASRSFRCSTVSPALAVKKQEYHRLECWANSQWVLKPRHKDLQKSWNLTLMVQRSNFNLQDDSKLFISSIYVISYPFLTIWKWVVWQKKNHFRSIFT